MPEALDDKDLRIIVVGPCGAGKSTLAEGLNAHGYHARQIAQEHSYVPNMWKLLSKPHVLIYLDASFETCSRRKQFDWQPKDHAEQLRRLSHARLHCDVCLATDDLAPDRVLQYVLESLRGLK